MGLSRPAAAEAPSGPPEVLSPLRGQGRWITDSHGRVVLLHGVNNVDKTAPFVELDDGFTLTAEDAALLAGHGFNTVRLGVELAGMMPSEGVIDEAYLDRIATVVDLLGEAGIYTLLDNHQDSMGAAFGGGNGFPDWAIDPLPFPGEIDLGWPLNSATMLSLNLAWTNFWIDTHGVVGHLGDAFEALAARVRGNPAVLGIEILNEPWPGLSFPTCVPLVGCPLFDARYQAVHQRLTDRIHDGDPAMPVFWEPNVMWNFASPTHLGQTPFAPRIPPGVSFSFHDYCALSEASIYLGLPAGAKAACDVQHELTYSNYDRFAARTEVPALITEFAGSGDPAVVARTMVRADARFLGWQYWHYESSFGPSPTPDPFTGELGRQLVRTYPQATAGTPRAMSYDPATGAFSYRYAPRAATAPTEIYISDVQYPDGYAVRLSGACASSAPQARMLVLQALPGAKSVDVAVTAGDAPWPACPNPGAPAGDSGDGGPVAADRALSAAGAAARPAPTITEAAERSRVGAAGNRPGSLPSTGGGRTHLAPAVLLGAALVLSALVTRSRPTT